MENLDRSDISYINKKDNNDTSSSRYYVNKLVNLLNVKDDLLSIWLVYKVYVVV